VKARKAAMVKLLLEKGADMYATNGSQRTPYELFTKPGAKEICLLFLEKKEEAAINYLVTKLRLTSEEQDALSKAKKIRAKKNKKERKISHYVLNLALWALKQTRNGLESDDPDNLEVQITRLNSSIRQYFTGEIPTVTELDKAKEALIEFTTTLKLLDIHNKA
jgi:hypothetical protein